MEPTLAELVRDASGGARSLVGRLRQPINRILFARTKNEVTTTAVAGIDDDGNEARERTGEITSPIFGNNGSELSLKRERCLEVKSWSW
ncbi:hypothetical protein L484_014230 [Morus notabilis]|uniref:Uncharacterized protein n=1 Tax=Morus notabilis TaxID=981085 RepID=W9S0B7_9ROSA|nr:hypothetical protein L484_014230 [Morus notabilis]